ncbi:hypothetical protein [Carboxylicivirga sp. N1Y90]|uniref:hypothetical protein n=1 Tax=Carboxylicivirga fragile TaxID=3417571 RepID=UPI003D344376|nr:PD40 domain-containing protein [Marinilabiliaceae bacterium N1Y90]
MKTFLTISLLIISSLIFSQSKELNKANNYFKEFNYPKAIKAYKALIKDGQHASYATQQIAISYSKIGNIQEAVNWYYLTLDFPEVDYNNYFLLARELLRLDRNDEAIKYMEMYYTKKGDTNNQYSSNNYKNYLTQLKRDSSHYRISNLAFNSEHSEFGPTFHSEYLVFSSNRPVTGFSKNKDSRTGTSFFNLFKANIIQLETSSNAELFSKAVQSKYNDGPVSFGNNYQSMFLTRNTDDSNVLDIFLVLKDGKNWSKDLKSLNIRKGKYNVAHAFIQSETKLLYFASNMPGGYGGMDLYVCQLKDGFLSKPTNLGPNINTIGNEVFPFISDDGMLYFSSDGQPGLGGYDLFFAKPDKETFSVAFNMGYPLNTSADDFSLVLNPSKKFGYFASNRKGGKGDDDIYGVTIKNHPEYYLLKAKVINPASSSSIKEAWIDIKDSRGQMVKHVKSDDKGEFTLYLKKNKEYKILLRKKLYDSLNLSINSDEVNEDDELEVIFEMLEK